MMIRQQGRPLKRAPTRLRLRSLATDRSDPGILPSFLALPKHCKIAHFLVAALATTRREITQGAQPRPQNHQRPLFQLLARPGQDLNWIRRYNGLPQNLCSAGKSPFRGRCQRKKVRRKLGRFHRKAPSGWRLGRLSSVRWLAGLATIPGSGLATLVQRHGLA